MRRQDRIGLIRKAVLPVFLLVAFACAGNGDPVPNPGDGGGGGAAVAPLVDVDYDWPAPNAAPAVAAVWPHIDEPPPVIPHDTSFGGDCKKCHTHEGREIRGIGKISPLPHKDPRVLDRCVACHVYQQVTTVFAESDFVALAVAPRPSHRATDGAPPVIPHRIVLRGNCRACHVGEDVPEAIRTTHPERDACVRCHVPQDDGGEFKR